MIHGEEINGAADSPKAPRPQTQTTAEIGMPQTWTARRSVPTSEVFGRYPESYHKLNLTRAPPQVGLHPRVSSTNSTLPEHLRGGAISPKAPRPQTWTARRSVPTSEVFGRYPESYHKLNLTRAPPQVGLHPRVSSTNSALPEHLRGGAISPKAPRPQTWTTAEIGLPQTWTARRSVPTSEVFGRYPES
jgi:hypothetical protein